MKIYKQSLNVVFDAADETVLYSGVCYYRSNLSDRITISRNAIVIEFERSKKSKPDELFNTQKSILRYYLQKALCFYLAVEGSIPEVKEITFTCNDKTVSLEHESYTRHWKNCHVDICLDPGVAQIIFESKEGKPFYIMMTHFLKAQLDNFSHDRFRSAWSSLNCLYTYIDALDHKDTLEHKGYRNEDKKLSTLSKVIADTKIKMPESKKRVTSLDEEFWNKLDWYNEFSGYLIKDFNQISSGNYTDAYLIGLICGHKAVFSKEIQSDDATWDVLLKKSEKRISEPRDRLRFLICKYCYHLRNRSFHAERAYPLFVIADDTETKTEKILTEIILLTVKDLFAVYSDKAREKT